MQIRQRTPAGLALIAVAATALFMGLVPAANAKVQVRFSVMDGYSSPGTPSNLNKVGVLKTGDPHARNVLVLNPGTSASAAYFEPLAKSIVKVLPNWQIWAVERRENFLEDQSELNLSSRGRPARPTSSTTTWATSAIRASPTTSTAIPDSAVPFARRVGHEHRDQRPPCGRQGGRAKGAERRHGRSLPRRLDHDGLRDVGLQRQAGRPGSLRASF